MTITDSDWAAWTPREQDAKVAEVVFGRMTCLVDGQVLMASGQAEGWQGIPNYASSWPGMGLLVERMEKLNHLYELRLFTGSIETLAVWWLGDQAYDAVILGPPSDSAPSATALAAVRAKEAEK